MSGWISAPDADGDGLYDFNQDCHWSVEVTKTESIQFQFLYILIEPQADYEPCIDYVQVMIIIL